MRAITKGPEPASLTAHRQTPHSNYGNYADKDGLRHALITEQRGICCYCMGRVHNGHDAMKIEHWRSQDGYPAEQLNYRNLLGACMGGEGGPRGLQHCDTRKGNSDLHFNPADPMHHIETRLRYDPYGTIGSDDAVLDTQLNEVLNLNLPVLKNARRGIYDAVNEWWKREKARLHGPVSRERLQLERDRYVAGDGVLTPCCQVAVWLVGQRLARMAA